MTYKRYTVTVTPRLKRAIAIILCVLFMVGVLIGLIIGVAISVRSADLDTEANTGIIPTTSPEVIESITDTIAPTSEPTVEPSEPIAEPVVNYYDCPLDDALQDYIRTECEKYDMPMLVIIALIAKESSFRPSVISGSNDYGLMQINTINHEWLSEQYGITDFLDPYQNVFCGILILGQHYQKYGDIDKALMAYNLGATGAKRKWDNGIYSNNYTVRVHEFMTEYENKWR